MLLIYTSKTTQRISYIFKHICTRILGIDIKFTNKIEEFISFSGPKISYGKTPLGKELFFQCSDLLIQQGFDSIDILVRDWEETKCFFSVGKASAIPFDMFSASFYLLSRYEEYLPHVKDEKGRFLASESLAYKEKFLQFPVIDIWAHKFKSVLICAFTEIKFPKKQPINHTIIAVTEPYKFKQKGTLRLLSGFVNDLIKLRIKNLIKRTAVVFGIRNDPYNTFQWIIKQTKISTTELTVLFLLGDSVSFMKGTNSKRTKFKLLLKNIADYKNVGLIFSDASLKNIEVLKQEKEQLENIINKELKYSLNSDFLVHLPENYRNLIELEIEKDFTLVYENTPGFRASTCTPFLFYDLDYEIVTPLKIQPIAFSTHSFLNKTKAKKLATIEAFINSINEVNGTFSVIFDNKDFSDTQAQDIWKDLFIKLS